MKKTWFKQGENFFIRLQTCKGRLCCLSNKQGMKGGGTSKGGAEGGNRSHRVKTVCLCPGGSSWAGGAAGRVKKRKKNTNIKRRHWTLTFLPSRKFRAVPMLATQWILFSFLPCSHGWRGGGGGIKWWWWREKRRERKTLTDSVWWNKSAILQVKLLDYCSSLVSLVVPRRHNKQRHKYWCE